MTNVQRFAAQHFVRYAGCTYGHEAWTFVYRVEYGALRSATAEKACNYSYREFWL